MRHGLFNELIHVGHAVHFRNMSSFPFTAPLDDDSYNVQFLTFEFLNVSVPQKGHQSMKSLFIELSIPSVL